MKESISKWFKHVAYKVASKKLIALVVASFMLYCEKLSDSNYVIIIGLILGVNMVQKFTGVVNDTTKK